METTDFSEELMQISCPDLTPINRVIKSIPNSSPFHNRLQVFENQIEEIDLALKKFDSHTPSTINKPAVTPTHADPLGDKSGEIIDIQGDTADSNSPHVTNHNTSHDTIALRTWKRLARNNIPPENPINHSVTHKRNRESCHNAIPVKQNLKRRHILNEDVCELCKLETESVVHALWGCSQLTQVWGSIPSFSFRQTQAFSSIKEVLIYTHKERKNTELLASVMWSLWHRRNQVRTSSKDYPLSQ
ncbi:hypothetical protein CFP56_032412, partial [Quercus suber]